MSDARRRMSGVPPAIGDGAQQRRVRVWVFEPDEGFGAELAGQLASLGCEVRFFTELWHAEIVADSEAPEVLVANLELLGAASAARSGSSRIPQFSYSGAPIVCISMHDDLHSRSQAARLGIADFFPRPLELPLLMDRILEISDDGNAADMAWYTATEAERDGVERADGRARQKVKEANHRGD